MYSFQSKSPVQEEGGSDCVIQGRMGQRKKAENERNSAARHGLLGVLNDWQRTPKGRGSFKKKSFESNAVESG